ncbi:protein FAM199X-like isoform X2 [Montipora foliosa]|uniref:protein FAM199X-like isoform X2 n=1 Tax=Montipora foliosa TaxID=591990 RepID=UPI0035F17DF0
MLAVPEDASEMSGQDGEDSFWCSESTSAASSAASSEYNSDNGLVDIEDEDVKRHLFTDSSSLNVAELERKCRELKAIDTSWRKCRRKRSPKRENSGKKTLEDILKRDWLIKNNKNSKSENTFKCPCQKLKDSMEFTVSWKKMSSDDQVQAVEILTRVASVTMGLKEQMDIIRIINPQATVLPTDTEFEIDLDAFDDAKFRRIHSYSMDHLSRYSCPLCSDSQSETCRQNTNFSHRKHSKRKASGNLSMKKISRKSSKHKELLKRVHRQMMKEQRSGLFENEEVISLSSRNEEESNDLEVDILC